MVITKAGLMGLQHEEDVKGMGGKTLTVIWLLSAEVDRCVAFAKAANTAHEIKKDFDRILAAKLTFNK